MTGVVLSIGSNVGDSLGHLRSVAAALGPRMVAASAVYSSAPWGGVEQQDFLNAVIIAEDPHTDPRQWLAFARECESAADRVRVQRWGRGVSTLTSWSAEIPTAAISSVTIPSCYFRIRVPIEGPSC